jgi:hypothetical protein
MSAVRISTQFTLSVALWIFALAALWLTAVPDPLGPSTYASIAALLTGLAAITMKTSMGGQATATIASLIRGSATSSGADGPRGFTPRTE